MMAGWAVFIGVDATVMTAEISGDLLDWLYRVIGCRIVESVPVPRDRFGRDDVIMMVDEEGLVRGHSVYNRIASTLCGQTIVGNAVLMRVGEDEDDELDWLGLGSREEAETIRALTEDFGPGLIRSR